MSLYPMAKQLILISVLVILSVSHGYYFTDPKCDINSEASCLNLTMIADNISRYINVNTTVSFIFQQGTHYLDTKLFLAGIELILQSNTQLSEKATIVCRRNARLSFTNVFQLWISGLNFIGCSFTIKLVKQFILEDSSFNGENANSSALTFNKTNATVL